MQILVAGQYYCTTGSGTTGRRGAALQAIAHHDDRKIMSPTTISEVLGGLFCYPTAGVTPSITGKNPKPGPGCHPMSHDDRHDGHPHQRGHTVTDSEL